MSQRAQCVPGTWAESCIRQGADPKTGLQYRKGCSQSGLPGQLGMKDLAARAPTPGHREWRPLRGWSVLGKGPKT